MSNDKQALLDCTFGWGKTCRLYADSLEIAGKTYHLQELTVLRPTYRSILGVPSARIELCFGRQRLVLRGIGDQETARLLVAHLQMYCVPESRAARVRLRAGRARMAAREQARAWERSTKHPTFLDSCAATNSAEQAAPETGEACASDAFAADPLSAEDVVSLARGLSAVSSELVCDPLLAVRADGWPLAHTRPLHTPRFQPPLRSVHLVPPDQKVQDTCSLPVPTVRSGILPVIRVPVRLQPGECAHYSIGAALCSDRISGSDRAPYPPLDHGLLILTNRRIFYIGKRSQLILAYTHLWYVSLLHNAIALHIEQQFRRIIIELEHPQEWAGRIEQLSCLARRTRPRSDLPTLLLAALPGLSSSVFDTATLKWPAIQVPGPPVSPAQQAAECTKAPIASQPAEEVWDCTAVPTRELSPLSGQEQRVEELTAEGSGLLTCAQARTQELPQTADPAEAATRECWPARDREEITTRELAAGEREGVRDICCADALADWHEEDRAGGDTVPLSEKTGAVADEGEQTIPLRDRRCTRAGERVRRARTPAPESEITPRRLSQAREPRGSSSRQEQG
ncbi:MAG TPA: hypothetical protein VGF67_26565 [Ktedonobacteraceae bacterium]|jgi:hypothetical protein